MEWTFKRYNANMHPELDPDPEFTPHDLSCDLDGTGARDGVEPKLRSKSNNQNIDLELDQDLELTPRN